VPPVPEASAAEILKARVSVPEHVVHRLFPTETILLNLQTGKYHGLNPTAGLMLKELEKGGTVAEAARTVANEHGQPVERVEADLCRLCADLSARGLISLSGVDA
jgi:hypothetical protein